MLWFWLSKYMRTMWWFWCPLSWSSRHPSWLPVFVTSCVHSAFHWLTRLCHTMEPYLPILRPQYPKHWSRGLGSCFSNIAGVNLPPAFPGCVRHSAYSSIRSSRLSAVMVAAFTLWVPSKSPCLLTSAFSVNAKGAQRKMMAKLRWTRPQRRKWANAYLQVNETTRNRQHGWLNENKHMQDCTSCIFRRPLLTY